MLPEHQGQASIVVVNDGVCGAPEGGTLQSLLAHLRGLAIACSFIQLRHASLKVQKAFLIWLGKNIFAT
jgi:hypothetical protein